MALVTGNITAVRGLTTDTAGPPIIAQRKRDETGAMQAKCIVGSGTVALQGRLSDQFSFMDLTDGGAEFVLTAGDEKIFADLPILPQVRARVTSVDASGLGTGFYIYVMQ